MTYEWSDVNEFVFSSEQIWRNLDPIDLLINGSSAVNGCRQNEIQTADKNITIIHKQSTQLQSIIEFLVKSFNFKMSLLAEIRVNNP